MKQRLIKNCFSCGKEMEKPYQYGYEQFAKKIYCSNKCARKKNLGIPLSKEHREKIRLTKISQKRKMPEDNRLKLIKANTGRKFTPEHRQKLSEQAKKRDVTYLSNPEIIKKRTKYFSEADIKDSKIEYSKSYYKKHRDRLRKYSIEFFKKNRNISYDKHLRKNFGITLEIYNNMLLEQNHICLICQNKSVERRLSVDHCHKTGKVRGLLCGNCNMALGKFKDNIELLERAIKYLRQDENL